MPGATKWFPDIANAAFCKTIQMRKQILERQKSRGSSQCHALEPSSAEFISALAAGMNSRNILQFGCGISTIALAGAAQATGGFLVSVNRDAEKQEVVRHHLRYLGLLEVVEFIVSEPTEVAPRKCDVDFAFLTGDPVDYIEIFDLLHLKNGAMVAADNALSDATNEYIRHVRRQPGIDSSTLPLARGIELTKVVSGDKFKSGRIRYCDEVFKSLDEQEDKRISLSDAETSTTSVYLSTSHQSLSSRDESEAAQSTEDTATNPESITLEIHGDHIRSPTHQLLHSTVDPVGASTYDLYLSSQGSPAYDEDQPCAHQHRTEVEPESSHDSHESLSHVDNSEPHIHETLKSSMKRSDVSLVFNVQFHNHTTETEVSIVGINQDMLLSDITTAFSEMGISVKTANISTKDNLIEDVFYVINSKTKDPIHPSQWDAVRDQILQRICQRWSED